VGLKYSIVSLLDGIELWNPAFLSNFNFIIHLGANSSTTMEANAESWNVNFSISYKLIDNASSLNIPVIFASSASVYGNEEVDFSERVEGLHPTSFYAFTKLKIDEVIQKYVNGGSKIYSFRFFNVYGGKREQYKGPMSSVIYRWLNIPKNYPIQLFRSYRQDILNGDQKRDFIHILDLCKVIIFTMNLKLNLGGIYNLGSGVATTYNEIANEVANLQGRKIEYKEMPDGIVNQYQYYTCANINKLRNVLGYTAPFITIKEGIQQSYNELTR
jgi:ADP-L-glycero-D-manno-heptose 6-epimerase